MVTNTAIIDANMYCIVLWDGNGLCLLGRGWNKNKNWNSVFAFRLPCRIIADALIL